MGEGDGCVDGGRGRRFWERVMVKEMTEEVSVVGGEMAFFFSFFCCFGLPFFVLLAMIYRH